MSSDQQTQEFSGASAMGGTSGGGTGDSPVDQAAAVANERPEVMVGAAFAGGFLAAMILKRLAG